MGNNAEQKEAASAPQLQKGRPKFFLNPEIRKKVVSKIANLLRTRSIMDPPGLDNIAQKFEEKVYASATDEKSYMTKVALKLKQLELHTERAVTPPNLPTPTGPSQLHSASAGNVQSESIKNDQHQEQSPNPSRLQPPKMAGPSDQLVNQGNVVVKVEKDSLSQAQLQQRSTMHKQVAYSGPTTQPEVSSGYRPQSDSKQQYESWQRDIASKSKSVPPQLKPLPGKTEASLEKPRTLNNKEPIISQPSRAHIGAQVEPNDFDNAHAQKVPSVPLHEQRILQVKNERDVGEQNHCLGVGSMSKNLQKSGTATIQSRSLPSEAPNRTDTSLAVERHDDPEGWRERAHQRMMVLKQKYQNMMHSTVKMLDENIKQLETHPNYPNKEAISKKLKEQRMLMVRIFRFLNTPKKAITPAQVQKLDDAERFITSSFNFIPRPKPTVPEPSQSLPSQTHSPHVGSTTVRNVGSEPEQGLQKNVSGVLPITRDIGDIAQAPTQTHPPILDGSHGIDSQIIISENSDQTNVEPSPLERLLKVVSSISPHDLKAGLDEMFRVAYMGDLMESSAPRPTSQDTLLPIGQDLGAMTRCRLQSRNVSGSQTWTPIPWSRNSILVDAFDTELPSKKRRKVGPLTLLLKEIRMVNQRLIDVVVEICKDDENVETTSSGTVVKFRYMGVSVNLEFMKFIAPSGKSSLIHPLRLLVPTEYPDCSPVVLDKLPNQSSEDLSDRARAKLELCLGALNSPFSVSEVARKWELCARDVIIEYAEKFGGGTFSSGFGKWENCMNIV